MNERERGRGTKKIKLIECGECNASLPISLLHRALSLNNISQKVLENAEMKNQTENQSESAERSLQCAVEKEREGKTEKQLYDICA